MTMNNCDYLFVLVLLQLVVCMLSYFRIKHLNGELEELRGATERGKYSYNHRKWVASQGASTEERRTTAAVRGEERDELLRKLDERTK